MPRARDSVGDLVNSGERTPGEVVFTPGQFLLTSGVSDAIVETGLPYSRRYDPTDELWRIRQIYARQAAMPPRRVVAFNTHRSLRRG